MAILVDRGTVHQTIDGFGVDLACIDAAVSDAIADKLFSPTAGIGVTWCRLRGSVVDGAIPGWADPGDAAMSNAGMVGTAIKARDRGARFWATADGENTTPAAWKIGGDSTADLAPAHYSDYAASFKKIVGRGAALGLNIERLSVCNEPSNGVSYTVLRSGQIIHDVIAAAAAGAPPLMLPETSSWQNLAAFADPTLNDAATRAKVVSAASHIYGGAPSGPYATASSYGLPVWQTEYNQNGGDPDASMISAGIVATAIHRTMESGWSAFNFFLVAGLSPFAVSTYGLLGDGYSDTKRFWAFGNYSKFVRPGFRRVTTSGVPAGLLASSYVGPVGETIIVVLNPPVQVGYDEFTGPIYSDSSPVAISLADPSVDSFVPWVTDATRSLAAQTALTPTDGVFSYTIPASSVVTFVGIATKDLLSEPVPVAESGADALNRHYGDPQAESIAMSESETDLLRQFVNRLMLGNAPLKVMIAGPDGSYHECPVKVSNGTTYK